MEPITCLTATAPGREQFLARCRHYVERFRLPVIHRVVAGPNMLDNLVRGIDHAESDYTAIIEDDDWYGPNYLLWMIDHMVDRRLDVVGQHDTFYYHIGKRLVRRLEHLDRSSLFTTVVKTPVLKVLLSHPVVRKAYPFIDVALWQLIPDCGLRWALVPPEHAIGIKHGFGPCLGAGHAMAINDSDKDPAGIWLERQIGKEDAQFYWDLAAAREAEMVDTLG